MAKPTASTNRIVRRVVSSKRHTLGFILDNGREVSRSEAIKLASSNKLRNVRVCSGPSGRYLQSTSERSLYELPEVVS